MDRGLDWSERPRRVCHQQRQHLDLEQGHFHQNVPFPMFSSVAELRIPYRRGGGRGGVHASAVDGRLGCCATVAAASTAASTAAAAAVGEEAEGNGDLCVRHEVIRYNTTSTHTCTAPLCSRCLDSGSSSQRGRQRPLDVAAATVQAQSPSARRRTFAALNNPQPHDPGSERIQTRPLLDPGRQQQRSGGTPQRFPARALHRSSAGPANPTRETALPAHWQTTDQSRWTVEGFAGAEMTNGKTLPPPPDHHRPRKGGRRAAPQCLSDGDSPAVAMETLWQQSGSVSSLDDISLASTASETAPLLDCPEPISPNLALGDLKTSPPASGNISLTLQPAREQTVSCGESVVLCVQAEDRLHRPISFQWYHGRQPLSGETQNILVLHNLTASQSGSYRCAAFVTEHLLLLDCNNQLDSVLSWAAEVEVLEQRRPTSPKISRQPGSVLVSYGDSAELCCDAEAFPPPDFKWHMNGVWLPEETGARLIIARCTEGHNGRYTCVVANSNGSVVSQEADIRVCPRHDDPGGHPSIVKHPAPVVVRRGGEGAELLCVATGEEPLCYQWYRNENPIESAVAATLLLRQAGGEEADECSGLYACSVSNHVGACWSKGVCVATCGCTEADCPHQIASTDHASGQDKDKMAADFSNSFPLTTAPDAPPQDSDVSQFSPAGDSASDAQHDQDTQFAGGSSGDSASSPSSPLILQHPPAKLSLSCGSQLQLLCRATSPTQAAAAADNALAFQWFHIKRGLEKRVMGEQGEQLDMVVTGTESSGTYYCRVTLGRQKVFSQPCIVVVDDDENQ